MNFENEGIAIAIIQGSKSKRTPILSVDDKKMLNQYTVIYN